MGKAIFYYTGAGNSLWVARMLAKELGDTKLISISDWKKGNADTDLEVTGLVFPVHVWGVPQRVVKFTDELKALRPKYIFAVAVNSGAVSNTLVQLNRIFSKKGLYLSSGFSIKMPSIYTPFGGPGSKEKQQKLFETAKVKISQISDYTKLKENRTVEKGPLWQRMVFTPLYKLTFSQIPKLDKNFFADEKCNKCGICAKVCPAHNITLTEGKPVWNHNCEQCFACLQWCPQESIQYGKNTYNRGRYHHPEIELADVIKIRSGN
jgi:ferredoxin